MTTAEHLPELFGADALGQTLKAWFINSPMLKTAGKFHHRAD